MIVMTDSQKVYISPVMDKIALSIEGGTMCAPQQGARYGASRYVIAGSNPRR